MKRRDGSVESLLHFNYRPQKVGMQSFILLGRSSKRGTFKTRRMRIYNKLGLQRRRPSYVDSKRRRRRSELLRNRREIRL